MTEETKSDELENKTDVIKDDSDDVSGINDTTPGATEEIEIDISEAGEEKADENPAAEASEKTSAERKGKKESRIRELNRKLRDSERRNEELERVATAQHREISSVNKQNIEQFELRASSAIDQAKKDLKFAIENGDVDAQVEANDRLSEGKAYLVRIREHKVNMGYDQERPPAREPERQQERHQAQEPQAVENPVKDTWIENNAWFDDGSEDYDEEMAADARSYATNLERKMNAEGNSDLVGKRAYFKRIDDYMKTNYPDRFDDGAPNRTPPMNGAKNGMSTPARTSALGADRSGGQKSNKITISKAEYEVALSLGNTSAGKKSNGERMNERELVQMYLKQKQSPGEQQNRSLEKQGFKERGMQV